MRHGEEWLTSGQISLNPFLLQYGRASEIIVVNCKCNTVVYFVCLFWPKDSSSPSTVNMYHANCILRLTFDFVGVKSYEGRGRLIKPLFCVEPPSPPFPGNALSIINLNPVMLPYISETNLNFWKSSVTLSPISINGAHCSTSENPFSLIHFMAWWRDSLALSPRTRC